MMTEQFPDYCARLLFFVSFFLTQAVRMCAYAVKTLTQYVRRFGYGHSMHIGMATGVVRTMVRSYGCTNSQIWTFYF